MQTIESAQTTLTPSIRYRVITKAATILFALFFGIVGFDLSSAVSRSLIGGRYAPEVALIMRGLGALVGLGFFVVAIITGQRFFKFGKGQYKKISSRITILTVIFSVVLSVIGMFIPNRYELVGFEGEGRRFYGRGFPGLVWFSGTERFDVFSSLAALDPQSVARAQFREECRRKGGMLSEESIDCVYPSTFSQGGLISNIVYWSTTSFLFAVVIVTLPLKKKITPPSSSISL